MSKYVNDYSTTEKNYNVSVNDYTTSVKTYYKELKNCKPISFEEEQKLIKKAKKNNLKAKNTILTSNLKFVFDVAKKYKGCGVDLNDLISEGNMGLTKAIDKFDESRNVKFITYAVWWIRQSIQEYIKKRQISESYEVRDELNELIQDGGLSEDDEDDEHLIRIDVLASNENEDSKKEIDINQQNIVGNLLVKLNERERQIVECYFGLNNNDEMTLEEIGEILKISKERVRQIKLSALRKLRSEILMVEDVNFIFSN